MGVGSLQAEWKITELELLEYEIPRTRVFATAKGSSSVTPGIFIRMEAEGPGGRVVESWGDALPRMNVTNETRNDAWRGANALGRHLIGMRVEGRELGADRERLEEAMVALKELANGMPLTTTRPPAAVRHLRATLCGFDIALLGLVGEIHGVPLFEVLGGGQRDAVMISGLTANVGLTPEEGRQRVTGARRDYRCVRLKVGTEPEEDLAMLRAAAEAIRDERPDMEIFVDVNQAWGDAATTLRELGRIREMLKETGYRGRFICEQPTQEEDFEGLAQVTKAVRAWRSEDPFAILIMADESLWDMADVEKLVAMDAVDQVNFKVQKAGGLLEMMRMGRYLAEQKPEWEIYVGGLLMTDVGATANLHLGHALPRLDYMTGAMARTSDVVNPATQRLRYRPGTRTLVAPTQPGLGTGVNLEVLAPYVKRTATLSEGTR